MFESVMDGRQKETAAPLWYIYIWHSGGKPSGMCFFLAFYFVFLMTVTSA